MTIFNEADIEAAARKIAVAAGRKEHDWAAFRNHTRIALNAAVASLEARNAACHRDDVETPKPRI